MKTFLFCLLKSLSIIGAIVGIGFVSGKEIYSFFFKYEPLSIAFVFLSSFLLFFVIYYKLNNLQNNDNIKIKKRKKVVFNVKNNTKSGVYCEKYKNNLMNKIDNIVVFVLCLLSLATMISGAENLFLGLGEWACDYEFLFTIMLISFVSVVVYLGGNIVLKISSISTFVLIIIMIVNILLQDVSIVEIGSINSNFEFDILWFFSAVFSVVFYVSMNTLSCVGVLDKISSEKLTRRQSFFIAFLTSLIIFVLMFLIIGMYKKDCSLVSFSMPLLYLSKNVSKWFYFIYLITLFSGCIVAIISVAFTCFVKLKTLIKFNNFILSFLILVCGYIISFFGFDFLVEKIYPLIGMAYLIYSVFKLIFKRFNA